MKKPKLMPQMTSANNIHKMENKAPRIESVIIKKN